MRIGSLFSGAGMLDVAALHVFPGASVAWHCENDPAASKILAHHWPDVLNFGDVAEIDWTAVEPVDVITGGFPCQDVSAAGLRAGLSDGTRSGLWSRMRDAIEVIRPRWVLIENVRGLLNAPAVRRVESDPDAVADGPSRPVLRAIGAVLGDLADIGYDAEWTCVRACDVGACHQRTRVLVLAHPADTDRARSQGRGEPAGPDQSGASAHGRRRHVAGHGEPDIARGVPGTVTVLLPTPSVADGTGGHVTRSGDRRDELLLGGLARAYGEGALLPTPRASDGAKGGPNQRGSSGDLMLPSAVQRLPPTPTASDGTGGSAHPQTRAGHATQLIDDVLYHGSSRWGDYEAGIVRQQRLSRPAPPPTEPTRHGRMRLSARFAEWMMFWPDGWVTDPALGLSRIEQLRVIGNGVVPPQAVAGFRHLHTVCQVAR
ncbi:DNA cytosine methyltransferase [Nocardia terpenica]|uniref:DNA cytosine methyltransferase n=1 Tax=Nocardia terpenica TaxID=455432 RepID=UPI001893712E|nr:DNA cytosine methyltransferase [Nocardia terpenica]MBF6060556.1 DNA cytosine methyltransferase [Nocardia terpenica]MBF6103816.1 DNA cytosine methyltransferase [Nocardia terpenica]MBF6111810.1 DNA cytosine methyltransferase [Nocardia terpenica]MBF6118037.1 DNA cytosine methyltransferase [Nocardia terpenica]MBF6155237.1 DNA cytosine methyltransferase [Nocardia terpenica]